MAQAFTPILPFTTTANTYGLDQNCYYCSVAALSNMTVEQFFNVSEIMQQDTATPTEILALWAEGGVTNVEYLAYTGPNTVSDVSQTVIKDMPKGQALGLAYARQDGSGHMVVLAKDNNGLVRCVDYQQNPPTITPFPPEPNLIAMFVFYKTP
ncbi:MAG TPA: hypothetical protein VF668_01055 [Pyrinomonadaceae bacterium]|jgi:hypothetical protein